MAEDERRQLDNTIDALLETFEQHERPSLSTLYALLESATQCDLPESARTELSKRIGHVEQEVTRFLNDGSLQDDGVPLDATQRRRVRDALRAVPQDEFLVTTDYEALLKLVRDNAVDIPGLADVIRPCDDDNLNALRSILSIGVSDKVIQDRLEPCLSRLLQAATANERSKFLLEVCSPITGTGSGDAAGISVDQQQTVSSAEQAILDGVDPVVIDTTAQLIDQLARLSLTSDVTIKVAEYIETLRSVVADGDGAVSGRTVEAVDTIMDCLQERHAWIPWPGAGFRCEPDASALLADLEAIEQRQYRAREPLDGGARYNQARLLADLNRRGLRSDDDADTPTSTTRSMSADYVNYTGSPVNYREATSGRLVTLESHGRVTVKDVGLPFLARHGDVPICAVRCELAGASLPEPCDGVRYIVTREVVLANNVSAFPRHDLVFPMTIGAQDEVYDAFASL